MATEKNPYRIVLKEDRLSYVHLKEAVAYEEGGAKKYSVTILMPKGGANHLRVEEVLQRCYDENKQEHFKTKAMTHKDFWYPLRDGDEFADEADANGKDGSAYRGMMFIKAGSTSQPNVYDENGEDVIDLDEVYSGCFGRISVTFWPYSKKGVGISCILNSVKKTNDGDPLGSAGGSHSEYEDDDQPVTRTPARTPAAAPAKPTPPAAARPAAAPRPPAPAPKAEPVAIWDVDAEGRDIYSWDGIDWHYAE